MGKAKKVKASKGETNQPKLGLAEQIELEKAVRPKSRQKLRLRADEEEEVCIVLFEHVILQLIVINSTK